MSKSGRQGSPAGSSQVLGAERNSKAKMLFRSLKLSKEFSPEKPCSKVVWLNCQLPGKHKSGWLCKGQGILSLLKWQVGSYSSAANRRKWLLQPAVQICMKKEVQQIKNAMKMKAESSHKLGFSRLQLVCGLFVNYSVFIRLLLYSLGYCKYLVNLFTCYSFLCKMVVG